MSNDCDSLTNSIDPSNNSYNLYVVGGLGWWWQRCCQMAHSPCGQSTEEGCSVWQMLCIRRVLISLWSHLNLACSS